MARKLRDEENMRFCGTDPFFDPFSFTQREKKVVPIAAGGTGTATPVAA
jgi:hypothetical protein